MGEKTLLQHDLETLLMWSKAVKEGSKTPEEYHKMLNTIFKTTPCEFLDAKVALKTCDFYRMLIAYLSSDNIQHLASP